ncbi:MAG: FAD-binding oxidoreductase [Bacteroidota bacterium]
MKALNILRKDGTTKQLLEKEITYLRTHLQGKLLLPGETGYDESRSIWNGMINRKPALIVQCQNSTDIQTALAFVQQHNAVFSVKGGGHHVAGSSVCDGGLMLDFSRMKEISVDTENKKIKVQAGATWGELDAVAQKQGLAVPGGVVSTTGVAGLTLGGGIGWLRRKYGLACDNLIGAEVITANGEKITASEQQHSDLFWALKGGGSGLGVVTTFEFLAHPVGPDVFFSPVFYPSALAEKVVRFYREKSASMPNEVSTFLIYGTVSDSEPFPQKWHGEDFILIASMYAGNAEEGEKVLNPYRELGTPIADFSGVMPYIEVQTFFDEDYPRQELHYYWKSVVAEELSDAAISKFIELGKNRPSPLTTVDIWQLGGAIDQVPHSQTAYPHRKAQHLFAVESNWEKHLPDQENIMWTRNAIKELLPYTQGSSYVNFEDTETENIEKAQGNHHKKLQEIRKKYDPQNLFGL